MSDLRRKRTLDRSRRRRRARYRVRKRLRGSQERPRLAVHKSRRHIYAQLIDDRAGHTLAFASSLEPEVCGELEGSTGSCSAAKAVGQALAARAREQGVQSVIFDRGGFLYHGRIRALADSARAGGLKF